MSALTTSCLPARVTRPERLLLHMAAAMTRFVSARAVRRSDTARGHRLAVQAERDAFRRAAQAHGAIGVLPR